jgi:transcriptional antiterminator NusG
MSDNDKLDEKSEVETSTDENTASFEDNVESVEEDLPKEPESPLHAGDDPAFKWYVVHVLSGYEHRVKKTLMERILNHNMAHLFSDILLPEETVVTNVGGKKRNMKKKFFPGYLLIKMIMDDRTWHLVRNTDKITSFVSGDRTKPIPLSEEEASKLTSQAQVGFKKPKSLASFSEGDSVKVIEGPFASFVGTVEAVSDKGKVKVNVSIFGRPTPVELDFSQIEKA